MKKAAISKEDTARITRTGRRTTCRLAANWPWTPHLVTAFDRVHQLRLRC